MKRHKSAIPFAGLGQRVRVKVRANDVATALILLGLDPRRHRELAIELSAVGEIYFVTAAAAKGGGNTKRLAYWKKVETNIAGLLALLCDDRWSEKRNANLVPILWLATSRQKKGALKTLLGAPNPVLKVPWVNRTISNLAQLQSIAQRQIADVSAALAPGAARHQGRVHVQHLQDYLWALFIDFFHLRPPTRPHPTSVVVQFIACMATLIRQSVDETAVSDPAHQFALVELQHVRESGVAAHLRRGSSIRDNAARWLPE